MTLLKSFGPWQLDSELRQLAPAPGGSPKLLRLFLTTLQHQLDSCRDFELAQAYLGLFLKVSVQRGGARLAVRPAPDLSHCLSGASQRRAAAVAEPAVGGAHRWSGL